MNTKKLEELKKQKEWAQAELDNPSLNIYARANYKGELRIIEREIQILEKGGFER